jgi:hypothetical protein
MDIDAAHTNAVHAIEELVPQQQVDVDIALQAVICLADQGLDFNSQALLTQTYRTLAWAAKQPWHA